MSLTTPTTASALLAAILDAPGDDVPRLVYADWLEEAGTRPDDAIRADIIRRQVGDWEPRGGHSLPAKWRDFFYWEGVRIFSALGLSSSVHVPYDWPAAMWMDGNNHSLRLDWRRGFVGEAILSAALWLAHGDSLLAGQPVEEVTLTGWSAVLRYKPDHDNGGGALYLGAKGWSEERKRPRFQARTYHSATGEREAATLLLKAEWPRVKTWHLPGA